MNIVEHVSWQYVRASFRYMSRSGIAGSSVSTMSNFLMSLNRRMGMKNVVMEWYSSIKKKKTKDFMKYSGQWMQLEYTILSEVTQSQRHTHGMQSLVSRYQKKSHDTTYRPQVSGQEKGRPECGFLSLLGGEEKIIMGG